MTAPPLMAPSAPSSDATAWLRAPERGTALALSVMIAICRLLGRGVTRLLLAPIVFYFVLFAPQARRASRDYLTRIERPHGFRAVYAHFLRFAHVTLDLEGFRSGSMNASLLSIGRANRKADA